MMGSGLGARQQINLPFSEWGQVFQGDRMTRSSYTRYDEHLPVRTGMVQAFLVTRHVLFVGFSLADDNFHRIVDVVRRLHHGAGIRARFGSALTLGNGGLAEVLWENDLERVRMDERKEGANDPASFGTETDTPPIEEIICTWS